MNYDKARQQNPQKRDFQRKIDFAKIGALSEIACSNIEKLLDALGVSLERNGKKYSGCCPIHPGSDNRSAFNIYVEGDTYVGNWRCRTKSCNALKEPSTLLTSNPKAVFNSGLIGFVQGVLSAKKLKWSKAGDKKFPYWDAVKFVCDVYGVDWDNLTIDESRIDKNDFLSATRFMVAKHKAEGMPREKVRSKLVYPCQYYLDRGFSREILDVYDVGMCLKTNKIMSGRAVVPVYEESGQYAVGFTGRLVSGEGPKWIHNGFKASETLYNYWFAYPHIKKSGTAILLESPGNAWRMVEAGYNNCVGLFGTEFSISQQFLLEKLGVTSIITLFDNDQNGAGDKARKRVSEECARYYNIAHIVPTMNDVAEMSIKDVKEMMNESLP
jgi:hypothetical protein